MSGPEGGHAGLFSGMRDETTWSEFSPDNTVWQGPCQNRVRRVVNRRRRGVARNARRTERETSAGCFRELPPSASVSWSERIPPIVVGYSEISAEAAAVFQEGRGLEGSSSYHLRNGISRKWDAGGAAALSPGRGRGLKGLREEDEDARHSPAGGCPDSRGKAGRRGLRRSDGTGTIRCRNPWAWS